MAGSRRPGPQDVWTDSVDIDAGTLCRAASPRPGPIGITTETVRDPGTLANVDRTETAGTISVRLLHLSLAAICRETCSGVGESLRNQILHLVQVLNDLRTTSVPLSALAGAPPGRRVGGLRDVLVALDLNFLPESINRGSGELLCALRMGDAETTATRENTGTYGDMDIITEELSRSVAILTRLILEGIVDYLAKDPSAVASSPSIASSPAAGKPNPNGVGDVAPLLVQLRSSKLGEAFATWIANNWRELLRNPRLRSGPYSGGGASFTRGDVVFHPKAFVSQAPAKTSAYEGPTFSTNIHMAAQAATLVAAAAQGAPFCPM